MRRYGKTPRIRGGKQHGTSYGCNTLYHSTKAGHINSKVYVTKESERLDIIAAKQYGSSHFWWIIAAASGVGWALQVPPGTVLRVPTNLEEVLLYVG